MKTRRNAVLHCPSLTMEDIVQVPQVAEKVGIVEILNCAIVLSGVRAAWRVGRWIKVDDGFSQSRCVWRNDEVDEISESRIRLDFSINKNEAFIGNMGQYKACYPSKVVPRGKFKCWHLSNPSTISSRSRFESRRTNIRSNFLIGGDQSGEGCRAETGNSLASAAGSVEKFLVEALDLPSTIDEYFGSNGLHNNFTEQRVLLAAKSRDMVQDRSSSSRFSPCRDLSRVSTNQGNVVLYLNNLSDSQTKIGMLEAIPIDRLLSDRRS